MRVLQASLSEPDGAAGVPALVSLDSRQAMSHAQLRAYLLGNVARMFAAVGICSTDRVGVALPNSIEASVAVLATLVWTCCAPVTNQASF